jgi:predicted nucleotidyltransferase component of viral defense system
MTPVSRNTPAGRAYLDLQILARRTGRTTQELLVLYVLERFLFRLSRSGYRDRLVLKGGMLLAALGSRRATADIDLLAKSVPNDVATVSEVVRAVIATVVDDDGVTYEAGQLSAEVIRDAEIYSGVRLAVPARVDRARAVLRVDVNVGDPVVPGPVEVGYPCLLGGSFGLLGYPLPSVLAEKLVTMIDRGAATTRERDFGDVVLLARRHQVDAAELLGALEATAAHRGSELRPLTGWLDELGRARQASWSAYVARSGLADLVPAAYSEAIAEVAAFASPLLSGAVRAAMWDPLRRCWAEEHG